MIQLTKQPTLFTPAGNPVIFGISANTNPLYYTVELFDSATNISLYTGKAFPPPDLVTESYLNLSYQLASLTDYDVDNGNNISTGKTKSVLGYKLLIKDFGISGNTIAQLTSGYTSSTFYSWNAFADILNYSNTNFYNKYVINSANTNSQFLTYHPNNKEVNSFSFEQLYFLQDGNDNLQAVVSVNGTDTTYNVSGYSISNTSVTASTPETRAIGYIAITGTSSQVGNNIGVFINGVQLGSTYSLPSTSISTTQIATAIKNTLTGNTSGYTVTSTGNTISIKAPVGTGAAANSFTLTTALVNTGTTSAGITASTPAVAIITGYDLPTAGSVTTVDTVDPFYGGILLAAYAVQNTDTTYGTYGNNLVAAINTNSYGYTASRTGLNTISITARTGTGANMNGNSIYYESVETGDFIVGSFSGGVTSGTGSTVTTYSIIPNSVTGFTGGINGTSASSAITTTNILPPMVRLQVSPKKLGLTLNNGDSYTVKVKSGSNQLSEERRFVYKELQCGMLAVNIAYVNSLGGVDSIQLYNPTTSINTEKQSIKKNPLDITSATPYKTNDRYNASQVTISSNSTFSFKATTKQFVSDDVSQYLVELVKSKAHYLELPSGDLAPVQLKNTNFNIQRRRISKEPVMYTFEFTMDDNFLPMLSEGIIINQ